MALPEPPEGNGPFEEYELSPRKVKVTGVVLAVVGFVILVVAPTSGSPESIPVSLIAAAFGFVASTFAHESLHYVTGSAFGYDAEYVWPTRVFIPNVHVDTPKMILFLLAPQFVSILYVVILVCIASPVIELMVAVGLVSNLFGGRGDVLWVINRIRWDEGTRVIVDEDQQTYVSFTNRS